MIPAKLKDSIDRITHYFRIRTNIAALYLFGSTAKKSARNSSDLDVAVMFAIYEAEKDGLDFLSYAADMEGIADRKVDLVCFNTADPLLKYQILKHGKILIDNDPATRIRLMVNAMIEYEDYNRQLDLSFQTLHRELYRSE